MSYPPATQAAALLEKHYQHPSADIIRSTLSHFSGTISYGRKTAHHLGICYHTLLGLCKTLGIDHQTYRYIPPETLPEPEYPPRPPNRLPQTPKS